ncbi:hypothetical protein ANCCAN_00683 [Ancylostoma caninum]|uniref:Uncharacterized protein n=1 Tax=Ancylostoma caninum TaxID=29170 RepID=A0A368HCK3_ANCCA|nr:hypothetical protein ANCCAN_00683 [Ancylostoma caninum]
MGTVGNIGMLLSSRRYRMRLKQMCLGICSRHKNPTEAAPKTQIFSSGNQQRRMFAINTRGVSVTT